jgi:hypothetical protein
MIAGPMPRPSLFIAQLINLRRVLPRISSTPSLHRGVVPVPVRPAHPVAIAVLVLIAATPFTLVAQEKPSAAVMAAMAGSWRYNAERSDPLADNPLAVEAVRVRPEDAVGGAPSGGGGGGRRGGGGGGAGAGAGAGGAAPGAGMGGRGGAGAGALRNPYIRDLVTQLQPPGVLVISLSDKVAGMGVPDGEPIEWTTDGKKRQKAQMDGTLLEFMGRWRGEKLTLTDGVSGTAELKRELHLIEGGAALEMKLELTGQGFPGKLERKVIFTRVE